MYIFNKDIKEYNKIPKVRNSAKHPLPISGREYLNLAYYKDW
jgi:hypothetical protein